MWEYHNDSIKEWYKPKDLYILIVRCNEGHKSCWDCGNIRLRGQFNRRCDKYHEKFIWPADAENELFEDPKEGGNTQADLCEDYFINPDLEKVIKERSKKDAFS